jgi:hypothetical protein
MAKGAFALRITPRIDRPDTPPDQTAALGVAKNDADASPDTSSQTARRAAARGRRSRQESSSPQRSKQSRVIEMLQRSNGSTISGIVKATGWQPHSVRGFFAGVVRKKLGLTLVSEKTGTERVYRIELNKPARKSKGRRRAA